MAENAFMQPGAWGGMRRGASVLELGAGGNCGQCASPWRYGSHANLERAWLPPWPQHQHQMTPPCCSHSPHHHSHATPQPYRRGDMFLFCCFLEHKYLR